MGKDEDVKAFEEQWSKVTVGSSELLAAAVNEDEKTSFAFVWYKVSHELSGRIVARCAMSADVNMLSGTSITDGPQPKQPNTCDAFVIGGEFLELRSCNCIQYLSPS